MPLPLTPLTTARHAPAPVVLVTTSIALALMAVVLLGAASADAAYYEFRQTPTGPVLGTMTVAEPPSGSGAWATTSPSDVISIFLDDALFGFGPGNVLDLFGGYSQFEIVSLDGGELDSGGIQDSDPGPGYNPGNMQLSFGGPTSGGFGSDIIESFVTAAFVGGNWGVANVPEPGTGLLIGLGLAGLASRRKRSSK